MKTFREITSIQKFVMVLTIMLLTTITANAGEPTSLDPKDYNLHLSVSATQVGACSMTLVTDTRIYVVHSIAVVHCFTFTPGTVLEGRIAPPYNGWPAEIHVLGVDNKSRPKVYRYSIAVTSVR